MAVTIQRTSTAPVELAKTVIEQTSMATTLAPSASEIFKSTTAAHTGKTKDAIKRFLFLDQDHAPTTQSACDSRTSSGHLASCPKYKKLSASDVQSKVQNIHDLAERIVKNIYAHFEFRGLDSVKMIMDLNIPNLNQTGNATNDMKEFTQNLVIYHAYLTMMSNYEENLNQKTGSSSSSLSNDLVNDLKSRIWKLKCELVSYTELSSHDFDVTSLYCLDSTRTLSLYQTASRMILKNLLGDMEYILQHAF